MMSSIFETVEKFLQYSDDKLEELSEKNKELRLAQEEPDEN